MIRSVQNPSVQRIRALQSRARERREQGAFVVEGVRLAEEAVASGWGVKLAFYTSELDQRGLALVQQLQKDKVALEEVSAEVMQACSDTQTPQGLLLEVAWRPGSLPAGASLVLVLDRVADPGNVGTLLRSAAAAGADAAVLAAGTADAFSPKVLRSGMGAQFRLPVLDLDWTQIAELLKQQGLYAFIAEANLGKAFDQVDLTQKLAFIIGAEAQGPSPEARALVAEPIHIPMPGLIESLNAATAGSLLLFEAVRQRRNAA